MRGVNQHNSGGVPATVDSAQSACHGKVVAIDGDTVLVQVNAPDACQACHSQHSCNQAQLAGRQVAVIASGFKIGDGVRLTTNPRAVLRASTVLYGIPALLVVVGAFAGYSVAVGFFAASGDLGSLLGVLAGLGLGGLFIHFYRVAGGGVELNIEPDDAEL